MCKVGQILDSVTEPERTALQNALQNSNLWSANELSNAIRKTDKHSVGSTVIKEHRRRQCACF